MMESLVFEEFGSRPLEYMRNSGIKVVYALHHLYIQQYLW
jgi:predicted Fe-Mo cluster-binding NifX family protein